MYTRTRYMSFSYVILRRNLDVIRLLHERYVMIAMIFGTTRGDVCTPISIICSSYQKKCLFLS